MNAYRKSWGIAPSILNDGYRLNCVSSLKPRPLYSREEDYWKPSIKSWVNQHPANRTHNPQLHTKPATWKPQVCTSSLQMHATIHHVHSHTITTYKRDTWPTEQAIHYKKPTKNTHTQPPRNSTLLVTNLDNTRHLRLRTQIPQKLKKILFIFLQHEIPQAATTV